MKKVIIAVDETEGSKAVLSVFRNMVRPPESVVLVHVQQLEGKSMMIDMLGDAERSTFVTEWTIRRLDKVAEDPDFL
jgi:hypothetical protein